MAAKIRLLIIDPQNDFCDGPSNGSLPVAGAYDDMTRLAGPSGVFCVVGTKVFRLSMGV